MSAIGLSVYLDIMLMPSYLPTHLLFPRKMENDDHNNIIRSKNVCHHSWDRDRTIFKSLTWPSLSLMSSQQDSVQEQGIHVHYIRTKCLIMQHKQEIPRTDSQEKLSSSLVLSRSSAGAFNERNTSTWVVVSHFHSYFFTVSYQDMRWCRGSNQMKYTSLTKSDYHSLAAVQSWTLH